MMGTSCWSYTHWQWRFRMSGDQCLLTEQTCCGWLPPLAQGPQGPGPSRRSWTYFSLFWAVAPPVYSKRKEQPEMITIALSQNSNLKISKQTNITFPGTSMGSPFALVDIPHGSLLSVRIYNVCFSLHSEEFNYLIFLNMNSIFPEVIFWWVSLFWNPFVSSLDRCLLLVTWLRENIISNMLKQCSFSWTLPWNWVSKQQAQFTVLIRDVQEDFRQDLAFVCSLLISRIRGEYCFQPFKQKVSELALRELVIGTLPSYPTQWIITNVTLGSSTNCALSLSSK